MSPIFSFLLLILFRDESALCRSSIEAQPSYQKVELSLRCFFFVLVGFFTPCSSPTHCPAPFFPALYIKNTFSPSVVCLLWELRFKSLTNIFVRWTAETTSVLRPAAQLRCHPLGLEAGPRTQGAEVRHLLLKKTDLDASVIQFTCNGQVVLYCFSASGFGGMCVSFPDVCTAEPRVRRRSPPTSLCGSSSDALVCLQILEKNAKMLAF